MSSVFDIRRAKESTINEAYFRTSAVKDWKHLLRPGEMKMTVIQSLQWVVQYDLVCIYG